MSIPNVSDGSVIEGNHKRGAAVSDRSRGSGAGNVKRRPTRLGVDNREYLNILHGRETQVPAPECVRSYQDILQKLYAMDPSP